MKANHKLGWLNCWFKWIVMTLDTQHWKFDMITMRVRSKFFSALFLYIPMICVDCSKMSIKLISYWFMITSAVFIRFSPRLLFVWSFILLSSCQFSSFATLLVLTRKFLSYILWFLIKVKFLREVTPYFRKASIISEVGWELQRAFLCPLSTASGMINPNGSNMMSTSSKTMSPPSAPAPKSPPRADTRYIPLQLTHLARNLKYHDPGMFALFIWNVMYILSFFLSLFQMI